MVDSGPPSSTHPLPSGDFPLESHFAVLRLFMGVSRNGTEPVELDVVEGQGVPASAARSNAAFLCDIGLLIEEKPGRFKPTAVAMQLINTQIADASRGRRLLRSIIEKTWFGLIARALSRTGQPNSVPEKDLISALAGGAHLASGEGQGSLRVLLEYLAYTGIFTHTEPGVLPEPPKAGKPGPDSPPSNTVEPTALPSQRPKPSKDGEQSISGEAEEWELVQTGEFQLKIQPSRAAIRRLRKQLDLLEQKIKENAKAGSGR